MTNLLYTMSQTMDPGLLLAGGLSLLSVTLRLFCWTTDKKESSEP